MLSLKNISKAYPPQATQSVNWVLQDLCIDFMHDKTCVVGANASGKSTLLLIIAGLLNANQGAVKWQVDWPVKLISDFCFDEYFDKTVDSLSTGSMKKLQLIGAFMRQTKVLLLDEPNIALDENSAKVLWREIKHWLF